jgi:hypothetical protein
MATKNAMDFLDDEDYTLTEDVASDDDTNAALEKNRNQPADEGSLEPKEEDTLLAALTIRANKKAAAEEFEAKHAESEDVDTEKEDMDMDMEDELAIQPENVGVVL